MEQTPPPELPEPTLATRLVSAGLWSIGGAWLASMAGGLSIAQRFVQPERLERITRAYTAGQVRLTGNRLRYVVHPAIRNDVPYAFMQNHVNHLDHCSLYNATPHVKQGMENSDHFKYPFYGAFMKTRGTIPVEKNRMRRILKDMRSEVGKGRSLIIFPEGTRTRDGKLGEFQTGVFFMVMQLGIPIVPVTVTGMWEVMNARSYLIRPGNEVTVYCDEPIPTDGLTRKDLPDLMRRVREPMIRRLEEHKASRRSAP